MKIKSTLIVLCLAIGKMGVSQVGTPISNFKKHTLELYYPSFYFFDNVNFKFGIPVANMGLSYSSYSSIKKRGWHVSVETHYMRSQPATYLGDVIDRQGVFLSYGIDKRLINRQNFNLKGFAEFNGRVGDELFYTGGSGNSWNATGRNMLDLGLSIGGDLNYRLPFGMTAFFRVKQSFYYYRVSRGVPQVSFDDGTPRNTLIFSFGLGWNFGK